MDTDKNFLDVRTELSLRRLAVSCPSFKLLSPPSPATANYNCIAFAADSVDKWWAPVDGSPDGGDFAKPYWHRVGAQNDLTAWIEQFKFLGYEECDNSNFQEGFEKVCIFVSESNEPLHMAKQKNESLWKSKCGTWADVQHPLEMLSGDYYGEPRIFMRRAITQKHLRNEA